MTVPSNNLTSTLARGAVEAATRPLPESVDRAARRSLLNALGTAIGASQQDGVAAVVRAGLGIGGTGMVPVPGTDVLLDPHWAAMAIGLAAHLDDFDDTHLVTVIHPAAAVLASTLVTSALKTVTGERFLRAFAVGCEVELRVGLSMSPSHYDRGWHITGTVAPLGAAVAALLLHDADRAVVERALSLAANMTLGHREGFGSLIKPYHPGKGAANGLLAATVARAGLAGPGDLLGQPGGYLDSLAGDHDPEPIVRDWEKGSWELLSNTFKPFPCGIVSHPAIEAACELAAAETLPPGQIDRVTIRCHPLVVELTGNPDPRSGLQARFSTIHGVAAGLLDSRVGLAQYRDERVLARDLVDLRARTELVVDAGRPRDSAAVEVRMAGGRIASCDIAHARGSLEHPLTDEQLRDKVHDLIDPVLPDRTGAIYNAVERLGSAGTMTELLGTVTAWPTASRMDDNRRETA